MKKLEQLVLEWKDGEASNFEYIYDATHKVVFFVVFNVVKNAETAKDLLQETYLLAVKNISSFDGKNFMAWLTRIAKNLAINHYNKSKREVLSDFSDDRSLAVNMQTDDTGLLNLASTLLDEQSYTIVLMCVVAGYKRREVAEYLSIPLSTVTWKYQTALKVLKENYKEV